MARRAVGGQTGELVRGLGGLVEIIAVARRAVEFESLEFTWRCVALAAFAVRVAINKRKGLGMREERRLFERLQLTVAFGAVISEFALVHIVVTGGARLGQAEKSGLSLGKHRVLRVDMAIDAAQFIVLARELEPADMRVIVEIRRADSRSLKRAHRNESERVADVLVVALCAVVRKLRCQRAVDAGVTGHLVANERVAFAAGGGERCASGEVASCVAGLASFASLQFLDICVRRMKGTRAGSVVETPPRRSDHHQKAEVHQRS